MQKEGNLDKARAVVAEIGRFKAKNGVAKTRSGISELAKVQQAYAAELERIDKSTGASQRRLLKQYDIALEKIEKIRVRQGDLDAADIVREERKRASNVIPMLVAGSGTEMFTASPPTAMADSPGGAISFAGHYYKVVKGDFTWAQAKAACEAQGGHLACIETKVEQDFIENLNRPQYLWIGGQLRGNGWKWLSGAPIHNPAWGGDHPINNHSHTVMAVRPSSAAFGFVSQESAQRDRGYICEWGRVPGARTDASEARIAFRGARLSIDEGVIDIRPFREGAIAYSNRKYQWVRIPKDTPFESFGLTPGGSSNTIRGRIMSAGWVYIAIGTEARQDLVRKRLTAAGWEKTKYVFAYTAQGTTAMYVYKKYMGVGSFQIDRFDWSGPIILLP